MISLLSVLKSEYKNKNVYIWNINRNSMNVFAMAIFRKIDIQGFVTSQEEYVGEIYMNRPVVALKEIEDCDDIIILLDDETDHNALKLLPDEKIVYWSDALELNRKLKEERIIIYGTGYGAECLYEELLSEGIEPELYCVTKKEGNIQKEKKIIESKDLYKYEDCAVIISVMQKQYRREILEVLSEFKGRIYVREVIDSLEVLHINLMQNLDLAIKENRKIYLYSKRNGIARFVEEALAIYNLKICEYVYDIENIEQNIKCIYELAYEGVEDKFIIINEERPENLVVARENIELSGFSMEKGNYAGIQCYTLDRDILLLEWQFWDYRDPLLGGSLIYLHGKPGWQVYGREKGNKIRILVLGGSTSSEVYHPENWISKLHYKLRKMNIETVIYNGAHAGNDVVCEILRLLRDGYFLKPQIVISMSGVNNLHYKESVNQFNLESLLNWIKVLTTDQKYCSGVSSDESLYSFWSRNEKLLEVISDFYGAKFFSFLQPINMSIQNMSLREKSIYELDAHIKGSQNFVHAAGKNEGYINMLQWFEHSDEMYFDVCHYTDSAHELLASKVLKTILPTIENLRSKGNDLT